MMPEICEMIMLICFGFSWPVSVIKNIRSRTALGMSLPFNLLIIVGYIAGISAKLYSGSISFVLAAYIVNLAMVLFNLFIYFRNRGYDRKCNNVLAVERR